ncbi:hypothetical protein WJX73_007460 [Symbiochloris irregularis]|uniref:Uncharacterized protein n=1 Tax=Symbiochloris irregularis TaxID=706552 RepID=A0AAW1NUA7_9CHLO
MTQTNGVDKQRAVIVTGARTGIGLEIALTFLRHGDTVVMTSRNIDIDSVEEGARDELQKFVNSKKAHFVTKDVSSSGACKALVTEAVDALGGSLDIVVNNAGNCKPGIPFEELSDEVWKDHFTLNLDSVFYMTQVVLPHLRKTKGCIVNVSSLGGIAPSNTMLPYCVAKAGVDMLTKATALEYANEGIRINSVNPGLVKTTFFDHSGMDKSNEDQMLADAAEQYPIGRVGVPSDVASAVYFLADNKAAAWITGQQLALDGGKLLAQ